MKKIVTLSALLLSIITLSACGSSDSSSDKSSEPKTEKKKVIKIKSSDVKNDKQATTFLKQQSFNDNGNIKKVTTVNNVMTIETKNIPDIDNVSANFIANILKYSSKLSLAKNGIGVVQSSEYMDNDGNKKDLLEYSIYYSKNKLDQINFDNYPEFVEHSGKTILTNSSGYYLMKEFSNEKHSVTSDLDLMKVDDQDVNVAYMDKYGVA